MQKVALITGCSSGIGEDIAIKLAKENWLVLAGVRKQSDYDAIASKHQNIRSVFLDVTNAEQIDACVNLLRNEQLNLDVLINNAGIAKGGPLETSSTSDWQDVFAVNVFGLVTITRQLLPYLRKTQGRIINISSVSGLVASPFMSIYAASKFAVEAISDSLRREVKTLGVSVSVVEPGPIKTKIWDKGIEQSINKVANAEADIVAAYSEKIAGFRKAIDEAVAQALDVSRTTEALYHACTSYKPKTRYIVSNKSVVLKILRLLPDTWADKLILSMR